jgi:xanthine dehydrogenase YagT iron-sulfur-binding subunit
MPDDDPKLKEPAGVSRREFLKISGLGITAPLVEPKFIQVAGAKVAIYGPGKAPVSLNINGRKYTAQLEPRVTLLDAMRNNFELTGAKRVCDRATCGACTVLMDGKPVYACTVLAIDAQRAKITTVEGLLQQGRLHPVQQAFVDNDAQQCGFCTPGFVVAAKEFLDRHSNPTPEQIASGLSGNLCRCGTYAGVRAAVKEVSGGRKAARRAGL